MSTVSQIESKTNMERPLSQWCEILADECGVYQLENGGYLAKRFSQIQSRFCGEEDAVQILTDNLHAILRAKYFPVLSDEILKKIVEIVNAMKVNLTSTLRTVTFNQKNARDNDKLKFVQYVPDGCVAFRNGVYDFRRDCWLFKYTCTPLSTGLIYIDYAFVYVVQWYLNFNFEPLGINVNDYNASQFVSALQELNEAERNMCFELVYNMSHDQTHDFSLKRFTHLCEILGFVCLNSFSQHFVFLLGTGQNGKNSLFDGCFTENVIPTPSSIDLDSIESDKFSTGNFEGVAHNIFLETSAKAYKESKMIKQLTGSENQTVEAKFVSKHQTKINCKFVFAGNDRQEIKFSDTTPGFLRRINMFEVFYHWDKKKQFLEQGDYYDASFSPDLRELKNDDLCATMFIYLAMFGQSCGTDKFTKAFEFTENEYSLNYADIDHEFEKQISIDLSGLLAVARKSKDSMEDFRLSVMLPGIKQVNTLTDTSGRRYAKSFEDFMNMSRLETVQQFDDTNGFSKEVEITVDETYEVLKESPELLISSIYLRAKCGFIGSAQQFNAKIQRIYGDSCLVRNTSNKQFIRCKFVTGRLLVVT